MVNNISGIIGTTINSVRYKYQVENDYGLQEFHTFFKLSNGVIIGFPVYQEELLLKGNEQNQKFYLDNYKQGLELSNKERQRIENQKIEDIYFCFSEGEIDEEKATYLKLENGYFITEVNYGPQGSPNVGLFIIDEKDFHERVKRLNEEVKSYLKEMKK